ncbi:ER membrane protein complex subunit 5 [Oratosquilla oratoria]|uniref:ER membrane protein complex subunit 5 n=1 Tax=Oratosquilla oratoria TaxID=337810 RepID=UPI003F777B96
MSALWSKGIFLAGILSMLHTAYSAAQHRSYLRITEQDFTWLPADIMVQGLLSLVLAMYGILYIAGDFKEIRATVQLQNKSWETAGSRPSFYVFSHRGKALSPNYQPPKSKASLDHVENLDS